MKEEKIWSWEGQDCGPGTQEGLSPEERELAWCGDLVFCS